MNRLITSSSHNSRRQFALVEQRSDAFSGVYPLDGGSKERPDGELGNLAEPLFRREILSELRLVRFIFPKNFYC